MTHSIRWLGSLVLAAAALVATGAAAQGSPAAPAAESRAPGDSAAAAGDTPPANAVAADSKADNFDRTPTDCVTLSNVRETVVIDDSTILFYMRGGAKMTYRNTLPHTCPNLARENRFSYKTTMNRLCNIALPRVRDFKGVSGRAFDGNGNYTMGLTEQIIFPEINYDKIDKIRGMNITFVTTAKNDAEGKALLKLMGMPFRPDVKREDGAAKEAMAKE